MSAEYLMLFVMYINCIKICYLQTIKYKKIWNSSKCWRILKGLDLILKWAITPMVTFLDHKQLTIPNETICNSWYTNEIKDNVRILFPCFTFISDKWRVSELASHSHYYKTRCCETSACLMKCKIAPHIVLIPFI